MATHAAVAVALAALLGSSGGVPDDEGEPVRSGEGIACVTLGAAACCVALGAGDSEGDALRVARIDGVRDAESEPVGESEGDLLDDGDAACEGDADAAWLALAVRACVGDPVWDPVPERDGVPEGLALPAWLDDAVGVRPVVTL